MGNMETVTLLLVRVSIVIWRENRVLDVLCFRRSVIDLNTIHSLCVGALARLEYPHSVCLPSRVYLEPHQSIAHLHLVSRASLSRDYTMVATMDLDIDTNYEMEDVSDSATTPLANGWTLLSCVP
jgi:hypothetical protein